MKLKHTLVAAAVALTAASNANALMDSFSPVANQQDPNNPYGGNSSLIFMALDYTGTPISAIMDLGFNVDTFLSSAVATDAGYKVVWDFNNNTKTVNGVAVAGDYGWSNAMAAYYGTAQAAETTWGVIAGDSLSLASSSTPLRYLTTTTKVMDNTTPVTQTISRANLTSLSLLGVMIDNANLDPGQIAHAEGGNVTTNTSAAAYVGQTFGTAGKWGNKSNFSALAAEGNSQYFYMLNDSPASTKAIITPYQNTVGKATFTYANGVLTYDIAAATPPIPEPSEYALMLAGLGMLGFMARRRLANRG